MSNRTGLLYKDGFTPMFPDRSEFRKLVRNNGAYFQAQGWRTQAQIDKRAKIKYARNTASQPNAQRHIVQSGNHMRPKNQVTKLFDFVNGIYHRKS